ncbi:MAG: polyprenyl synthetase family protein [Gemmatimonadaceae bacterium]
MRASESPASGSSVPMTIDLAADRASVDRQLERLCSGPALAALPTPIAEAIRYSILGQGKRLRPILMLAAYRACGGEDDASALAACMEVVHAYSLVHDDLPCMDDDDMRRGRATTHRVHGVAIATAAGVVMVPLAVRAACDAGAALGLPNASQAAIVRELMRASGGGGMVGGQLLDLEGEGSSLSIDQLERIHSAKTGALISASARIGGIAAGANAAGLDALTAYGDAIGLAFQIADDVLDATSTTAALGKTAGRDVALRKSTYPMVLGVDSAIERAASLVEEACDALERAKLRTPILEMLARYAIARTS